MCILRARISQILIIIINSYVSLIYMGGAMYSSGGSLNPLSQQFFFFFYSFLFIYIIVGSRFSSWAQRWTGIQAQQIQYNEFVKSGCKSWGLMGQRFVWKLRMIKQELRTEPGGPTSLGKGLIIREYEFPLSLTPQVPSPCGRSLILYILSFGSSSSYTCQSSMPILECTSHWPLLTLCELLWP